MSRPSVIAWKIVRHPSLGGQFDAGLKVLPAGMNPAVGNQADQMQPPVAVDRLLAGRDEGLVVEKEPSATAVSIRARSCLTIAPAPRLR